MILNLDLIGEGEPVVFLHTGLQTGASDFKLPREILKDQRKVLFPDLRGHGKSIHDEFQNYFVDSAKDLKETLDDINIDKVHLVGCSLGGLVSLLFAKQYPERITSLTLSGVTADKPDNWDELHADEASFQKELLNNKELVRQLDQRHESDWKQFIRMAENKDWYPFDFTSDLEGIKVPILYIVGEGNKAEVESAVKYQRQYENVHVSVIPFASHLVHEQKPLVYAQQLEEFLDLVDGVDLQHLEG